MQTYKVVILAPVAVEVEAYTVQQAVDAAIEELKNRHRAYRAIYTLHSVETLQQTEPGEC